ncbi:hypothetical protein GP486_003312 [Trichoglossum hirsutum]|uniref:Uncharacterized protein n=1 Tax=Trichoglossum hirsutum TaxID=265104 RepID=A0A9P8LDB0_9PEZI|nr:hypothetical protein GP486_003312 [Trichoglossum hirsutum]
MDPADLARLEEVQNDPNRVVTRTPSTREKLGSISVAWSGIFVTPAIILKATDSVGITIILWAVGGVVAISGLLTWLELGLTIPRFEVEGNETGVPRSGGEKNYVSTD